MRQGTSKTLRIGSIFLVIFLFCALALLPQPVRAARPMMGTITGFINPVGVAITPNGEYVYVANEGGTTVSVISTTTNTITANITVGNSPFDLAITPNGEYAYVTNQNSSSVSVISAYVLPTVVVSPEIPAPLDAGQSQLFTATPSGGSGTYSSYQWYVNGFNQSYQTASTFSFAPTSMGTYAITATITDSSNTTSAQSNTATVMVNTSPTVTITPVGPLTLTVDEVQLFTAKPSGGSGTISYQWYLDGSAVGSNTANYSYTAAETSHSVTCKVTDSASTPVTSPTSNAVSVTVNPTAAFVFGWVDWLIVIIIIIIITVLLFMLLLRYSRHCNLAITVQNSQTLSPISGASVEAGGPKTLSGTTGSNGQIVFKNVQKGEYLIKASAAGYNTSISVYISVKNKTNCAIKLNTTKSKNRKTRTK